MEKQVSKKPVKAGSPSLKSSKEEGTYYEKVFAPQKVKVFFNDKNDLSRIVLEDKNRQTLEVSEPRLVSRTLMYFAPYTEFGKISELRELDCDLLQKTLNLAVKKRNKDLKALYDEEGRLCGIASTLHEQISWKKVKEIVEGIIKKVTGQVVQPDDSKHLFRWTYKVPVKDDFVSSWIGVNAGNNIVQGRSGIKIYSRFRTEKTDTRGGVKRPACLNWCGMWQFPQQFFKVPMNRMDNIIKLVGKENLHNIELAQWHIRPDLAEFKKDVEQGIVNMVKTMKKITPIIDKSINSKLKRVEMQEILWAYQSKTTSFIPDYVVEQILNHVEDETVWGFSQAVSWVRTHGEFRMSDNSNPRFKPVEERDLTYRLESIAGEVLSLTPTIVDIHKKHGDITLEFLVGKEDAKRIREEQAKKLEPIAPEILTSRAKQAWATRRTEHPEKYSKLPIEV